MELLYSTVPRKLTMSVYFMQIQIINTSIFTVLTLFPYNALWLRVYQLIDHDNPLIYTKQNLYMSILFQFKLIIQFLEQ